MPKHNKCKYIRFTKKCYPFLAKYNLNGFDLKEIRKEKYLGVYFSSTFPWAKHMDTLTVKANRVRNFIKRGF